MRWLLFAIVGLDLLGLARLPYPGKLPDGIAIGVVEPTFGDASRRLDQIIRHNVISLVRVHLTDGTVNHHACRTTRRDVLRSARKWAVIAINHPSVGAWYTSPSLEHNCRRKTLVNGWFLEIKRAFPSAVLVCSAWKGYCPPGIAREIHGSEGGEILSLDGQPKELFKDLRNNAGVVAFYWEPCMNGRRLNDKPIDPAKRKYYCTKEQLRAALDAIYPHKLELNP